MNIARLKRVGRWPFDKLVDAIVWSVDLLLRFLLAREWSPRIKVKKYRSGLS